MHALIDKYKQEKELNLRLYTDNNKYFELKKLVGHQWGAPNSNYLLAMWWPGTFVTPFSINLDASHAHIKTDTHMHT